MSASPSPGGGQTTVKVSDLSAPQLTQLKKQLDEELTHLTNSFTQLRAAQSRFKDCLTSLSRALAPENAERTILVPLTSSLYVPGRLAATEMVIVDVGTGFYVEKSKADAATFYERKIKELQENLVKLETVVRQKSETLSVIEEALRQKILQANAPAAAGASAAAA